MWPGPQGPVPPPLMPLRFWPLIPTATFPFGDSQRSGRFECPAIRRIEHALQPFKRPRHLMLFALFRKARGWLFRGATWLCHVAQSDDVNCGLHADNRWWSRTMAPSVWSANDRLKPPRAWEDGSQARCCRVLSRHDEDSCPWRRRCNGRPARSAVLLGDHSPSGSNWDIAPFAPRAFGNDRAKHHNHLTSKGKDACTDITINSVRRPS